MMSAARTLVRPCGQRFRGQERVDKWLLARQTVALPGRWCDHVGSAFEGKGERG
jgi:hypothetical protein